MRPQLPCSDVRHTTPAAAHPSLMRRRFWPSASSRATQLSVQRVVVRDSRHGHEGVPPQRQSGALSLLAGSGMAVTR